MQNNYGVIAILNFLACCTVIAHDLLCFIFCYLFFASFLYCSFKSYRSPNCRNSDSYRSFLILEVTQQTVFCCISPLKATTITIRKEAPKKYKTNTKNEAKWLSESCKTIAIVKGKRPIILS